MNKTKKKQIKTYISWGCIAILVLTLALMPVLASKEEEASGPQASILSGTVETGSIQQMLHGGGVLTNEARVEVTLPEGVKITEFLVKNGDTVTQGQPLATVDRVSVMTAITQVQESMDFLLEEMNDLKKESGADKVTAQGGGRIKAIYGQPGDSVQEVMLEHGALAILSLDGMMALSIQRDFPLTTGSNVLVTLEDGTETTGRVESNLGGTIVITVEDEGYAIGTLAVVTTEDGTKVGSGNLYVHNEWKATAYFGTIAKVNVQEETMVNAGKTLFTLKDTTYTAQLESLTTQHREYQNMMMELFRMYQDRAILAPCDGTVSGIDLESPYLLSAESGGWTIQLLANAPQGDPNVSYMNYSGQITDLLGSDWQVRMNPTAQAVTDYAAELANASVDTAAMTATGTQAPVTVYRLVENSWEIHSPSVGDVLLFAWGDSGCVWAIYLTHLDAGTTESTPTEPPVPDSTEPTVPGDMPFPGGDQTGGRPSGMGTIQMPGGITGYGTETQEEDPLFSTEEDVLLTILSGTEMTVSILLDEQDISMVQPGMTASVVIDALKGASFQGTITDLEPSGTNNGGSSKFTVTLTLPRDPAMLAGMSATVTIPLDTMDNIPVIPVAALQEQSSGTVVFTALDDDGEPANPIPVTTGISDGEQVQILSGLEPGQNYYYAYYDTLEISNQPEQNNSLFG